jgi:hypothetical protein
MALVDRLTPPHGLGVVAHGASSSYFTALVTFGLRTELRMRRVGHATAAVID